MGTMLKFLFILSKIISWIGILIFILGFVLYTILTVDPGPGSLAGLLGLYVMAWSAPFFILHSLIVLILPLQLKPKA